MAVLVLLVTIGTTIVVVRLFLNGAREARAAPAQTSAVSEAPVRQRRRRAASTTPAAEAAPSPSARWPGGRCPACGNQVAAGAKFCGECGNRLAS